MEACRPDVDAWLLDLLAARPFKAREFLEERDGRCRLTPLLAHELAESIGRWRSVVAPIVELVADRLGAADHELVVRVGIAPRKVKARVRGLTEYQPRARIATTVDRRRKHASDATADQRCKNCGEPFRGKRCKECGFAPTLVDDAGADRQRAVMIDRQRTNRDWVGDTNGLDFHRDILPSLQGITLRRIMDATGLSKRFASQIRNGLAEPHPRHWHSLLQVTTKKNTRAGSLSIA